MTDKMNILTIKYVGNITRSNRWSNWHFI